MSGDGSNTSHAPDPHRPVGLPAVRLLLIPALFCVLAGAAWAGGAALARRGEEDVIGGLLAGAAAAAAVILAMLLISPWRARPLTSWPFVFLLGTMIQTAGSLAAGFLLYFATSYGTVSTWLCLVVAYWAGLVGLVRIYGSHMKRFAPREREQPVPSETGAAESPE